MQFKNIIPLALAAGTSAQSLSSVLAANNASLSTLNCKYFFQFLFELSLTLPSTARGSAVTTHDAE